MNADGSGWQQLTDSQYASFNANLSPDGQKAVYVISNGKYSEIYELNINTGSSVQLTDLQKNVGSPEISPDNKYIVFHYHSGNGNISLWIMNRDGSGPREFYKSNGKDVHDATWSPDGTQILFALGKAENNQFYIMDFNGDEPQLVNDTIDSRGRKTVLLHHHGKLDIAIASVCCGLNDTRKLLVLHTAVRLDRQLIPGNSSPGRVS